MPPTLTLPRLDGTLAQYTLSGRARARGVRQVAGRLRQGVRAHPEPGARARHHPLAGGDVRSRAGRLLGLARPRPSDRDAAGDRPGVRAADRWREDLAAGPEAR